MAYGVCKEICMPVEAELSLDLDMPVRKADREELLKAMGRVPRVQGEGAACPHRLASAELVTAPARVRPLRVLTDYEPGAGERDVLVEAPLEAGLAAPAEEIPHVWRPRRVGAGQHGRASCRPRRLPVSHRAGGGCPVKDNPLTFTMVSDRGSCETILRVK